MNYSDYIKKLIKLSVPIILGQLGFMLIGAGDVLVASRYSTATAGSIGVAIGLSNPIFLFGVGLMMGISPVLSIKRGEGSDNRDSLSSILVYAFSLGMIIAIITLILNQLVPYLGLNEKLVESVMAYNNAVAFSFPFAYMFNSMREYLQSYEEVMFPNLVAIIAVFVNLGLNVLFVFGAGDFKGFGEIGLAYASFGVRIFMFTVLFTYILRRDSLYKVSFDFIKKTFKFSLPIAIMFFLEVTAFCAVSVLSGKLDTVSAAANNIIMTLASIAFMVPMAISSAVAVKIGNGLGRKDAGDIIAYSKASMGVVTLFACGSAMIFYFFRNQLMALMTTDQEVISLGAGVLIIIAIFQLFDSVQVNLHGILRGLKQTRVSSIIVLISFWIFGIPTGYYLTFYKGSGIEGLWIGLAIALALACMLLFIIKLKVIKNLERSFAQDGPSIKEIQ